MATPFPDLRFAAPADVASPTSRISRRSATSWTSPTCLTSPTSPPSPFSSTSPTSSAFERPPTPPTVSGDPAEPRSLVPFACQLAFRIARPVESADRRATRHLFWSCFLASVVLTFGLAAPFPSLSVGRLIAAACVIIPVATLPVWFATRMRQSRAATLRALRQAGAEPQIAWFISSLRIALVAVLAGLLGISVTAMLHPSLDHSLADGSPLRAMLAGTVLDWARALLATPLALLAVTLTAVSSRWSTPDPRHRAAHASRRLTHPDPCAPQASPTPAP